MLQQAILGGVESASHPYHDWITLYSSDEFQQSVELALTIGRQLAQNASLTTQQLMVDVFVRATQLEWLFWHSAYHQQQWLI